MISRDNPLPLYLQTKMYLEGLIRSGDLHSHSQVPSELELASRFGISRTSTRLALVQMVNEGWLYRVPGKGTFVATERKAIESDIPLFISLSQVAAEKGLEVRSIVLDKEVRAATDDVAESLRIQPDTMVVFIKRLRTLDNQPFMMESFYMPYSRGSVLLDIDLGNLSLIESLGKRCGVKLGVARFFLSAIGADAELSDELDAPIGSPLLSLEGTAYDRRQTPVITGRIIQRSDKHKFYVDQRFF